MSNLLELAARCETAAGPNVDLQYDIMTQVLGYRDVHGDRVMFDRGNDGYWTLFDGDDHNPPLPDPTESMNTAMSLIPQGMSLNCGNDCGCWAHVWKDGPGYDGLPVQGSGSSLALAICAAALKALSGSVAPVREMV